MFNLQKLIVYGLDCIIPFNNYFRYVSPIVTPFMCLSPKVLHVAADLIVGLSLAALRCSLVS